MDQNKYVLALDVGGRRIGLAVASVIARFAAPLPAIDRQKVEDVYQTVIDTAAEHQAGVIVIGLPRGMDGQETDQTRLTRDFAKELGGRTDAVIVMQDEAGTSLMAESNLKARKKQYQKGDIDSEAAVIILGDYLQQEARQTA